MLAFIKKAPNSLQLISPAGLSFRRLNNPSGVKSLGRISPLLNFLIIVIIAVITVVFEKKETSHVTG